MSFIVYILYSQALDQYYVGHTADLNDRLYRHRNSGSKSTKKASDWTVVYQETYSTRPEAATRELHVKKRKSRKYIEALISSAG